MLGERLNPPYSKVCSNAHVTFDDEQTEPPLTDNGTKFCTESGCRAKLFTHCETCEIPLPGKINGRRTIHGRNVAYQIGSTEGTWRTDCHNCRVPYPWASKKEQIQYHLDHRNDPEGLPLSARAEAAFNDDLGRQQGQATAENLIYALEWLIGATPRNRDRDNDLAALASVPSVRERGGAANDPINLAHIVYEIVSERIRSKDWSDSALVRDLLDPSATIDSRNTQVKTALGLESDGDIVDETNEARETRQRTQTRQVRDRRRELLGRAAGLLLEPAQVLAPPETPPQHGQPQNVIENNVNVDGDGSKTKPPRMEKLAWLAAIVAVPIASYFGYEATKNEAAPQAAAECSLRLAYPEGAPIEFQGCEDRVRIRGTTMNADPHWGPSAFDLPAGVELTLFDLDAPNETMTIRGPQEAFCFGEADDFDDTIDDIVLDLAPESVPDDPRYLLSDDVREIRVLAGTEGEIVLYGSCFDSEALTGADLRSREVVISVNS